MVIHWSGRSGVGLPMGIRRAGDRWRTDAAAPVSVPQENGAGKQINVGAKHFLE